MRLLLLIFVFVLLDAKEYYYNPKALNLATVEKKKKLCQTNFTKHINFCVEYTLSYPTITKYSSFPDFSILQPYIQKELTAFENKKFDDYLDDAFGGDFTPVASYYHNEYIDLKAITAISYSLSYFEELYTGGAHPNSGVSIDNINKKTKKVITLDDIITDKKAFLEIAELEYKKQKGLKKSDSLEKDGWFENNFTLAKNFLLTNDAIIFIYNPYEIKAYVYGYTSFILPYKKVAKHINQKLFAPILKNTSHTRVYYFAQENGNYAKVKVQKTTQGYRVFLLFSHLSSKGFLSLSFPNLHSKRFIKNIQSKNLKNITIYPKGSKIYNQLEKKAIKSSYTLLEGEIYNNKDVELSFDIVSQKGLEMLLRAVLKEYDESILFPSTFSLDSVEDQQGYEAFRVLYEKP